MTSPDGIVSSQAPLRDGTRPVCGSSAVAGSAGTGDNGGRGTKRGKELAFAGGSSAAIMGSPQHPSQSLKGEEAEAKGGERKRKTAASCDSSKRWPRCQRGKTFKSLRAIIRHQHVHKKQKEQQVEGGNEDTKKAVSHPSGVSTAGSLRGTQRKSVMRVQNNQPQQQVQQPSETKGGGSALAEGGPSSSEEVEKAKRKEIHMKLDLNNPTVDDGNGDEEGA
ncbi:hypothetical protein ACJRO7_005221 [Eucalyptus globulus]|uniref:C2H2-type domain-containing protein n=1 Tax=Eucalyptus globulus TaxID=34317 RepID=A0ABD3J4U7_EUCGL